MAYDYKRHTQTARIQALSDLLKTVKQMDEPDWAAKEAIRLQNDMLLADHKAELALTKKDEENWKQLNQLDILTAKQLEQSAFVDLTKDPLVKGKESWIESQQRRRENAKGRAESDTYIFKRHASKRYKRLRQKDYAQMIPDIDNKVSKLELEISTAQGIVEQMPGDRRVQSGDVGKKALLSFYQKYFSGNYQQEWKNYGSTAQRNQYGLNLARVEAMMISMGMEIPEYSISSEYLVNTPTRPRDIPEVY
jgi:paraquat-inducible protein B